MKHVDNPFEIGLWEELCYSKRTLGDYHGRDAMAHLAVGSTDTDDDLQLSVIFEQNPEFEMWLIENGRYALLVEDYTVGLAYREGKRKEPACNTGYVVISKPRAAHIQDDQGRQEI